MERGRESRRVGVGGGLVHAPRRPRTGFKDAAVGDDVDDMMDDVHNSRLRERAKKDGGGVSGGHGVATSMVGPSSRNKRKRQGSQEMQVHARNSPADEVEETTEDTEMGVSEDDDDPPPPIIPRRPGKPRPQEKFAEDGIAVDLPAVPRKARTAIGKRPQEAAAASVAESPGHRAGAVAVSTPAPSGIPSSSSMASLKPGRRTKPGGSKPRGLKLAKVSTPFVSDQEVEVAEALFDLARMFTQPAPHAVESRTEAKSTANEVKSEARQDTKVGGSSLPPQAPNGPGMVNSGSSAGGASVATVGGTVRINSPGAASVASPAPSPAAAAGPVAEGAKRKRPRVRSRTEEGGVVQPRTVPSVAVSSGTSGVSHSKDTDQSTSRASTAERSGAKLDGSSTIAGSVVATANNGTGIASSMLSGGVASSGMGGLGAATMAAPATGPAGVVGGSVGRVEKKGVHLEKKIGSGAGKAEGTSTNLEEKRVTGSPVREKMAVTEESTGGAGLVNAEVEGAPSTSVGVGAVLTKMEVEKRSLEKAAGPSDGDQVLKRDIDLMVAPSKVGDASNNEDGEIREGDIRVSTAKRAVDATVAGAGESSWADREQEREEKERAEKERAEKELAEKERVEFERAREKERERELESERIERELQRIAESQRESAKEAVKERETEREAAEVSKAGVAAQRRGKSAKVENGRALKGELAGSETATSFSTIPASVAAPIGSVAAGVGSNVAVLPMSVGMLSWPTGMGGGLGYFPAAASAEDSSPSVKVAPYMMGQRATWKRCAQHVYIAHFIDMQQQLSRHQSFFTGGNQAYQKSYNLNVPLTPSESLFGGVAGSGAVGIAGGAAMSVSSGGAAAGAVNKEVTDRGLNAAVMAAAAVAGMQGVKERGAYNMDLTSRKSPGQHQGNGHAGVGLSLQTGVMFGYPNSQSGSPSGASAGAGSGGSGGGVALGGTNLNLPPGSGGAIGHGSSSGGVSSSALGLGLGGLVGGLASGGGSAAAASVAVQQAQYMQAMMQQSGPYPFAQFPPHFGPATFSGPGPHMGAQQAAAHFFTGGPYFTHHLVAHPQQQAGQQSGGSVTGAAKMQQQQQQGGSRSLGGTAAAQPPSHSQVQSGAHTVSRAGEREGSMVGENASSGESKFPSVRGSALASGGSNAVSVGPGLLSLQSGGAADYNVTAGSGKQSKSREQGQGQGQQGGSSVQLPGKHGHHYPRGLGGGVAVGRKGMEGVTSGGVPVNMNMTMAAAINNRGASVGPGPLGLAPVAAVMAPQGHAMIQSMAESGRGHHQGGQSGHSQMGGGAGHSGMTQQQQQQHQQLMQLHQAQQHAQTQTQQQHHQLQQQQQQPGHAQHLLHQRGSGNARNSGEDSRDGADGSYGSGRGREREVVEERKMQGKRVPSSGGASPLSRDVEGAGGMQSSPGGGSGGGLGGSRTVGTTLNLMAPTSAGMGVRSSGHSAPLLGAGATMQAQAMSGSKAGGGRAKGSGGPGPNGGSVAGGAQLGMQASFSDRVPVAAGATVALSGKASPTGGLSLGVQNMVAGQVGQQAQGKGSQSQNQRPTLGSGTAVPPTVPGTDLQAVLAAAMAKNLQGQSQQMRSAQGFMSPNTSASANLKTNANVNANANPEPNAGSSRRMSTTIAGPGVSSGQAPASMAPPTKSSGANPGKSNSSGKSAIPLVAKGSVGGGGGSGGGKRPSSPSSTGHGPSILGPSPLAQNISSNSSQQPPVQMQGLGQGVSQNPSQGLQQGQFSPPQLHHQQQQQQQFHHQQQLMRQQHILQQQHQQQMFQQHHQQQQQQQQSHQLQGSLSAPPLLQAPQQSSHQPQQQPGQAPQAQQVSGSQQNQQQHAHVQQQASHHQQQQQQFSGSAGNGSLAFNSMGAGNSSSGGGGGRGSNSESGGVALNGRPLQSVKLPGSGSNPVLNAGGQRGSGTGPGLGAGPAFLPQFGSSVAVPLSQQQSGSPRGGNPSGYLQGQASSNSGPVGGRASDGKSLPDGGQEHANGVWITQGSAQARGAATMTASPGVQGSSQRSQSGGAGSGAGLMKQSGGGQFKGFGDAGQLRTNMMSNANSGSQSGPQMSSSNMNSGSQSGPQMSSSSMNVESVGNGRPAFNGGSLHGGGSGQGQIQPASTVAMTGAAVAPSGPAAVLGPAPTTSVVEQ